MPFELNAEERAQLVPADRLALRSPIPTRPVSSDEFMPGPQSSAQREFEARVRAYGTELARHQGLSRRRFFQTASGMAAAFLAMNDTWGPLFAVSRAEAATPERAAERASSLSGQFIMDMHTHFLHDKTRLAGFVRSREAVGRPDSIKRYTIGDNTNKPMAKWPWRMDDETLAYPYYERALKAGIRNVCVHKGLFPPHTEKQYPHLLEYCQVGDVAKAARDWPQLNFIIYHSAYRYAAGGRVEDAWAQVQRSGRVDWVSDLAELPAAHGVRNVYADLGQIFAQSTMADPNLAAFMMGTLIRGLGADRVVWGTDAIWTGSPQWQIEALRRLEIPEGMRRQYGFSALGAADGPVKNAIFGENNARLYDFPLAQRAALAGDRMARAKAAYEAAGTCRSNLAYGYVRPSA